MAVRLALSFMALMCLASCQKQSDRTDQPSSERSGQDKDVDDRDWPGYGRTSGEQHFSPISQINTANVSDLGLAWYFDLPVGNSATQPIEVGGVLYISTGLGTVRAIDVRTGRQLWEFDSAAGEKAGARLRQGWGIRGVAYWKGKVYTGTADGRLIALDAASGKVKWTADTLEPNDLRYITGAPRVFDGKVIIGHGGADSAPVRGYVTTYDAETGRQLWRFYTVPGNPAKGFRDKAEEAAARTWAGEWWKFGGGGTAWNAFTYDGETNSILVGTGNGAPWNHKVRSAGEGDNLFLASVVALDANTGAYKWHYQVNPGETWDYNAAMDLQLANLTINGKPRKVLITAPKNGFLYVIDRTNGKLISAEKIAKVTWAEKIDIATGRPVENPDARFRDGKTSEIWPGPRGAHSWMPSAFSPQTSLVYIPKLESGAIYNDRGINPRNWAFIGGNAYDAGMSYTFDVKDPLNNTSSLLAWDPVRQRKVWEVKTIGGWNGGAMATGGNLVFQGQIDGRFSAYSADKGKELWHYDTQNAVLAAPISYVVDGKQYVTVVVGMGTSAAALSSALAGLTFDYYAQKRRVLTFALGGTVALPPAPVSYRPQAPDDPSFKADPAKALAGAMIYGRRCVQCHGADVISGGYAPDLRVSAVPQDSAVFRSVVQDGSLVAAGMPRFDNLGTRDMEALRQYIRQSSADLRNAKTKKN